MNREGRMAKSRYRVHFRELIEHTLARLPAGADEKEARKALRGLVASSPRHQHQMYLKEVKAVLTERYGSKRRRETDLVPYRVLALPAGVLCDWCKAKGCIACSQMRSERETFLSQRPELISQWWHWLARLQETPEDDPTRMAFADWFEENNWPEQAARERLPLILPKEC